MQGSIHENMVTNPLLPAKIARRGVIQHTEAVTAVSKLTKAVLFDLLDDFILGNFFNHFDCSENSIKYSCFILH